MLKNEDVLHTPNYYQLFDFVIPFYILYMENPVPFWTGSRKWEDSAIGKREKDLASPFAGSFTAMRPGNRKSPGASPAGFSSFSGIITTLAPWLSTR